MGMYGVRQVSLFFPTKLRMSTREDKTLPETKLSPPRQETRRDETVVSFHELSGVFVLWDAWIGSQE